jgi:hypothetical protein
VRVDRCLMVVAAALAVVLLPVAAAADTIDRTDRAAVRTAYEKRYGAIADRLTFERSPWTGAVETCDAGTLPSSVRDNLMEGVNFFRALAGVEPSDRDPVFDANAQAAALVMHANGELSHHPPSGWACWSAAADEGASHSNLWLHPWADETFLHDALEVFIDDPGPANTDVGHRRWLLSPYGGPYAFGATSQAMALSSLGPYPDDGHVEAPTYIAWPPDGYFPTELATRRWSLSHTAFQTADLSSASVSMTMDGSPVDIVVDNDSTEDYGFLPTVSWDVTDPRFGDWITGGTDVSFDVTVSDIEVDGATTSRSYTVTMAGGDEPTEPPADDHFVDDDESIFEADIEWLASQGITNGCDASGVRFCPDGLVTRGQIAAFLVRALGLPDAGAASAFVDDDRSVFEADIAALHAAGITAGCDRAGTRYCPGRTISRGQMAAFLVRALELPDAGAADPFADDDGSIFEHEIAALHAAAITGGCNRAGTRYCQTASVTRGQMAAFLRRGIATTVGAAVPR